VKNSVTPIYPDLSIFGDYVFVYTLFSLSGTSIIYRRVPPIYVVRFASCI